jgi:hypothetical protein
MNLKNESPELDVVLHICNPSYLGGRDGRRLSKASPQTKSKKFYLKNKKQNKSKKDWECGSSGRAPA